MIFLDFLVQSGVKFSTLEEPTEQLHVVTFFVAGEGLHVVTVSSFFFTRLLLLGEPCSGPPASDIFLSRVPRLQRGLGGYDDARAKQCYTGLPYADTVLPVIGHRQRRNKP
jgi:hypothetical protein